MKKESEIQKEILDYLNAIGVWVWRNYNGPMIQGRKTFTKSLIPGSPDIMGIMPCGKSIQIEVKRDLKSSRSKEQIEWIKKAQDNNAIAFFSHSVEHTKHMINHECGECVLNSQTCYSYDWTFACKMIK